MKIIIGTRGSQLSLAQTNLIKQTLHRFDERLEIEIKIITTTGDTNMAPIPLDTVGKGWFTKELDKELLAGTIDIAVHSLKDLPETLPNGLIIAGIPQREDPRDVLVSKTNKVLTALPPKARIGTDSIRRKIQILQLRHDCIVQSVRGNVNTRLSKLAEGKYDALLLAAAGLKRLEMTDNIAEYFSVDNIVPSPGQGTLAVVTHEDNTRLLSLLTQLNHRDTVLATEAERAFAKELGGGCKTPTGAYALVENDIITVLGMIGTEKGEIIKDRINGPMLEAKQLGKHLAKTLVARI